MVFPIKCKRCNKFITNGKKMFEGDDYIGNGDKYEVFCRTCKMMSLENRISRLEFIINTMKKNKDEIEKPHHSF